MTHVAYGVGPMSMTIQGERAPLFTNLPFGQTTGFPGNPYDTTTSRISLIDIFLTRDSSLKIQGNAAFQQGARYSIFFFDTLNPTTVSLIILQDSPPVRTDTLTTIRFLNFSPDSSFGIKLIYTRDDTINTIHIAVRDTTNIGPSPFVGKNQNPGAYPFNQTVHIGMNQVFAFVDSASPNKDSSNFYRLGNIQFDSTKSYNVYLQGFPDSTSEQTRVQIKSMRVN